MSKNDSDKFLTDDQRQIIAREMQAKGALDDHIYSYLAFIERTRLDHFARQVMFSIRRQNMARKGQPEDWRPVLAIQTTIDGFRLIAERTGKYAGQVGPWWCGADGEWKDAWLQPGSPVAAKVGVLRNDFKEPLYAPARFASYNQGGDMWARMPEVMLAKCAEALALRRAFPHELSGVYTADEIPEDDAVMTQQRTEAGRHAGIRNIAADDQPTQVVNQEVIHTGKESEIRVGTLVEPETKTPSGVHKTVTKPAGAQPQQQTITPPAGNKALPLLKKGEEATMNHLLASCRRLVEVVGPKGREQIFKRLGTLNEKHKCGIDPVKKARATSLCPADHINDYYLDVEEEIRWHECQNQVEAGIAKKELQEAPL